VPSSLLTDAFWQWTISTMTLPRVLLSLRMSGAWIACALAQPRAAELACDGLQAGDRCRYRSETSKQRRAGSDHFGLCYVLDNWSDGHGGVLLPTSSEAEAETPAGKKHLLCLVDADSHFVPGLESNETAGGETKQNAPVQTKVIDWLVGGGWIALAIIASVLCCGLCIFVSCTISYFSNGSLEEERAQLARLPTTFSPGSSLRKACAGLEWSPKRSLKPALLTNVVAGARKTGNTSPLRRRDSSPQRRRVKSPPRVRKASSEPSESRPAVQGELQRKEDNHNFYDIEKELREAGLEVEPQQAAGGARDLLDSAYVPCHDTHDDPRRRAGPRQFPDSSVAPEVKGRPLPSALDLTSDPLRDARAGTAELESRFPIAIESAVRSPSSADGGAGGVPPLVAPASEALADFMRGGGSTEPAACREPFVSEASKQRLETAVMLSSRGRRRPKNLSALTPPGEEAPLAQTAQPGSEVEAVSKWDSMQSDLSRHVDSPSASPLRALSNSCSKWDTMELDLTETVRLDGLDDAGPIRGRIISHV